MRRVKAHGLSWVIPACLQAGRLQAHSYTVKGRWLGQYLECVREGKGWQNILLQFWGAVRVYYNLRLLHDVGIGTIKLPGKGKAILGKLEHNLQLLMLTQICL